MDENQEVLDCFDQLIILTMWRAILSSTTFLIVLILVINWLSLLLD